MTAGEPNQLEALIELGESMLQLVEFAEGQRAVLEKRGWSPTAAEDYSRELLVGLTRMSLTPPPRRP